MAPSKYNVNHVCWHHKVSQSTQLGLVGCSSISVASPALFPACPYSPERMRSPATARMEGAKRSATKTDTTKPTIPENTGPPNGVFCWLILWIVAKSAVNKTTHLGWLKPYKEWEKHLSTGAGFLLSTICHKYQTSEL